MQYYICQIGARQYLVKPGTTFEVDKLNGVEKSFLVDKVLLSVQDGKVEIGKPFLKTSLELEVLGNEKKEKIRVAKFHAKANYRRVIGSRREVTKLRLAETKKSEPKSVEAKVKEVKETKPRAKAAKKA